MKKKVAAGKANRIVNFKWTNNCHKKFAFVKINFLLFIFSACIPPIEILTCAKYLLKKDWGRKKRLPLEIVFDNEKSIVFIILSKK